MAFVLYLYKRRAAICRLQGNAEKGKGENMKIVTIGDSITVGTYTAEGDDSPNSVAHPNFSEYLKDMLGCDSLKNYAINGISISSAASTLSEYAIATRYLIMEDADIVLVCAGTNDYGCAVKLGSPDDTEDNSFFGSLDVLFRGLKRKYPMSEIYFVTPLHRSDEDENLIGLSLEEYRCAIEKKARQYGIDTVDGFGMAIDPNLEEHRRLYSKDGVHIDPVGHRLYAEYVYEKIIESRKGQKR